MRDRIDPNRPMTKLNKPSDAPRVQYAALPYRQRADGRTEVMLVTSRDTGRWVIPKGWPMKGRKPHASAAREALEEAGLIGQIGKEPIGSYFYDKRLRGGEAVPCRVEVFVLKVKSQRKRWPEKGERSLRWFAPEEAADAVHEADLADLFRRLATLLPPPEQ